MGSADARRNHSPLEVGRLDEEGWSPMNWRIKSRIQRYCDAVPGGGGIYAGLQRAVGRHRRPDYGERLDLACRTIAGLAEAGVAIEGASVMEVGTGYAPTIPVLFWLAGASRVETFDLNRYLRPRLAAGMLGWIADRAELVESRLAGLVDPDALRRRLATLDQLQDRPLAFLKRANIAYHAPADAAATGLADGSIDVHFSAYVMEHVPPVVIEALLREASRVLRPGGVAAHRIDPTDHFAHADPTISTVHFLRFDEESWRRIGGNRFAYHNRLRDDDYRRLFLESPLHLVRHRFEVDSRAVSDLRNGFPLAPPYRGRDPEDLARCRLDYIARKPGSPSPAPSAG
ncbi:class I SAM-dependent methyltransferase [Tautonia sociabilis]|uniref:Class I SAM-dependent methyltransferase n=1 Tax=Tautonia sociabilis TaxID=2080755 RepID=A0A432MIM6_9BACT|nr:class I SAM-dependent methyltransferase [Tautonia sociabilis]RUL87080.1 class I SAM-dependent methyltransferase [Tautonia sociabilis]